MSENNLKISEIRYTLPHFPLEASFNVYSHERVVLVGRSGSGKTTLLRIVAGLIQPEAGKIFLGEKDLGDIPTEKREIGFIFQNQALFPFMSVGENISYALKIRGVSKAKREEESIRWIKKLNLNLNPHADIDHLSGGERQRIAFARTLIAQPKVLLLDEPFSALDTELRHEMRRLLLQLHEEFPVPMIFVTHDRDEAKVIGTRILQIENGKVLLSGAL